MWVYFTVERLFTTDSTKSEKSSGGRWSDINPFDRTRVSVGLHRLPGTMVEVFGTGSSPVVKNTEWHCSYGVEKELEDEKHRRGVVGVVVQRFVVFSREILRQTNVTIGQIWWGSEGWWDPILVSETAPSVKRHTTWVGWTGGGRGWLWVSWERKGGKGQGSYVLQERVKSQNRGRQRWRPDDPCRIGGEDRVYRHCKCLSALLFT